MYSITLPSIVYTDSYKVLDSVVCLRQLEIEIEKDKYQKMDAESSSEKKFKNAQKG